MTRFLLVTLIAVLPSMCLAQADKVAVERGMIEVHVSFVEFPMKVIARETVLQKTGVLPHVAVTALWIAQEGDLLHTMSVITQSGLAAESKQVEEIIYPTEFEVDPALDPRDKDGARVLPIVRPTHLETREVGYVLNATPTVSPDGKHIDVTLVAEHSWMEESIDIGPNIDGSGFGSIEVEIEQPIFSSHSTTTSVRLRNGEPVVLGGLPTKDGDATRYMILSASLY